MKAVVQEACGSPDVLALRAIGNPAIKHHEVGLRVRTAGSAASHPVEDAQSEGLWRPEGRTPQRGLGTPRDIAEAVVYLAGDSAAFVTDSVITVDGGWDAFGTV